jgi:hypothetical protein
VNRIITDLFPPFKNIVLRANGNKSFHSSALAGEGNRVE